MQTRLNDKVDIAEPRKFSGIISLFKPALPSTGAPAPAGNVLSLQRSGWIRKLGFIALLLPTLASSVYLAFIASDRYVSETRFIVRTAAKPVGAGGFGAILQMAGLSRSNDDVHSIQAYLTSRDVILHLGEALPIREMYNRSDIDFYYRFPSFIYGSTQEEFYNYTKSLVAVTFNMSTGITTLTVQAFRADDAFRIATTLLKLAEEKVNELNKRIHDDAIKVAMDVSMQSEQRLTEASLKITDFRNRELMIDPTKQTTLLSELIGRLNTELASAESRRTELVAISPNNPALRAASGRATALQAQIQQERARFNADSDGLANKMSAFEKLTIERDYAKQALNRSLENLELARSEARRQQLFLERVVTPNLSDYSTQPKRLITFSTVLALNLLGLMIFWLVMTGLREHSHSNAGGD